MSALTGTLQSAMTMMTPLLLAALGETVVQRAGVVNVGIEGMMLVGAFAATVGTISSGNAYAGVGAGAGAGLLLAGLFALFAVRLAANQVVVGVVTNLLALGLTGTAYQAMFGKTGRNVTTETLPHLIANQNALTLVALLLVGAVWWGLYRTRSGLELRACGEQPVAAEAAGVNVARLRALALLFGGGMAGVAGAFLSVGQNNTFIPNMTSGRGFIALAIVTSGRWSPLGCLLAALVFGFADALQYQAQALGLGLPHDALLALPYLVTLAILMAGGRWSRPPEALGRPYRKA